MKSPELLLLPFAAFPAALKRMFPAAVAGAVQMKVRNPRA